MNNVDTYMFMHFPRNSGTAFKKQLKCVLGKDNVFNNKFSIAHDDGKVGKHIKIASPGHCWYGIHDRCEGNVKYIGLVRNPVDRVISSFYYLLYQINTNPDYLKYIVNMDLENWVDSCYGFGIDNLQVRMLNKDLRVGVLKNYCVVDWLGNKPKRVTKKHYENAVKIIDKDFAVIDTLERRVSFLDRLGKLLDVMFSNRNMNSSVGTKGTSKKIKDKLKYREKWDMKLYEHIKRNPK